ncbi:hypothetical protein PIB30_092405 [Stylosanthes scabra]|uniref:F-box domain-containing protein n=1 Tax=Stylosanthes scabra TaxID=79078 RepID=A0ABU6VTC7_9FABA|nr:hypothetical protein [Stylosanthes scabra]
MSDIPPKTLIIPYIPDEICHEIFKRCDPKTLRNVRATSRYWRQTLSSYEFVSEVSAPWKSKGCSLISHFGFNNTLNSSNDWVMNMDPVYGEGIKLQLPILTPGKGWFRIIGVENGIFLFRFCSTGHTSYLLAWNPAIGSTKLIPDPPRHYCSKCAFLYTFAYFPNNNWVVNVSCPEYVRTLDPDYVSLDGVMYWMNWRENDRDMSPTFIVSFSMLTFEIRQIFIPTEATANYHGLLINGGKLYLGAVNYDHERYSCTMWEIDSVNETPSWNKLLTYDGYGHPYLPALFIDGDVIQVLEKYY